MRVLVVAPQDPTGSLYWFCRALRAHHCAQSRLVVLQEMHALPYGPPTDINRVHDGGAELEGLLEQADVLHLVDVLPQELPLPQRLVARASTPRWVLQISTATSPRATAMQRLARDTGTPLLSHDPALTSATFLPPWIPYGRPPWIPQLAGTRARLRSSTVVAFASSSKLLTHQPRLEALVERAERHAEGRAAAPIGCRVDVWSQRDPRLVAQHRRRAHVTLCDAAGGMPFEALESWLQGVPVVADVDAAVLEAYEQLTGTAAPIIPSTALEETLARLDPLADPDPALVDYGRSATAHSRWFDVCTESYTHAPPARMVA